MHITRTLRRSQTPWESRLWNVLRGRKIKNLKFRRQHKIGKYIVDFCCLERKCIVELDGGHHNQEQYQILDKIRENFLKNQGYKIIRFWNTDIESNMDGVVQILHVNL